MVAEKVEGQELEVQEGDDDGVLELAPHYQYISGLRSASYHDRNVTVAKCTQVLADGMRELTLRCWCNDWMVHNAQKLSITVLQILNSSSVSSVGGSTRHSNMLQLQKVHLAWQDSAPMKLTIQV